MVLDIWWKATQTAKEETCYHHYMGYSFRLAASHTQDSTHYGLWYTSHGALDNRMRNSSMGPPWRIDLTTHCIMNTQTQPQDDCYSTDWHSKPNLPRSEVNGIYTSLMTYTYESLIVMTSGAGFNVSFSD